ncbi:MAG: elongation factor Ts [Candidatus Nealsonbacteria bacterium]
MASIEQIKELRNITGVSIAECKKALEKTNNDIKKAKKVLKDSGKDLARKRLNRETKAGIIDSYIHSDKKVGVLLKLQCESDFVARSDDFLKLAHELCLQIAASVEDKSLLKQSWIKDQKRTVKDLIDEYIVKFGENIIVEKFIRYEI